jgi:D-serine deaminase-like pyridoxal phosphate-dependent protein
MSNFSVTIQKPTLLLNHQRAIENIRKMAEKAQRSGVRFRPHFKTHQSAQIGEWFRDFGVKAITVSSVEMAQYFAQHGWQDITIAFPANVLEIDLVTQLAERVNLGLLVESTETVHFLAKKLTAPVNVWLKVDVGYGRTGVPWSNYDKLVALAKQAQKTPPLSLHGLLTHSGHTYRARSGLEIQAIYRDTVSKMRAVQENLAMAGVEPVELSIGDTPSCSVVADLSDVDEIRPGNFVFYDLMQLQIGACREQGIAVAVACPVVAKHPERHQLVIYGGAVHLSKEFIVEDNVQVFGYVAWLKDDGWSPRLVNAHVSNLSQEHGIITADDDTINQVEIGDLLVILPVHSCLAVNLMREYLTFDGEKYSCM